MLSGEWLTLRGVARPGVLHLFCPRKKCVFFWFSPAAFPARSVAATGRRELDMAPRVAAPQFAVGQKQTPHPLLVVRKGCATYLLSAPPASSVR